MHELGPLSQDMRRHADNGTQAGPSHASSIMSSTGSTGVHHFSQITPRTVADRGDYGALRMVIHIPSSSALPASPRGISDTIFRI